ncbi:MAG: DUF29 domain-containing protein [Elainella sp.]
MSQIQNLTALHDQDILLWSEEIVAKLKARDFEHLDIENLIAEVEALGIAPKKELLSRLIVLLEHLLKRLYVALPYAALPNDYNGWERTIRTQRTELELLLDAAPSLRNRWAESFDKAWRIALKNVHQEYGQVDFPAEWTASCSPEAILNDAFWLTES